jgi:HPt (histidine-containing phosphotransfer) domain-containing protein
MATLNLTYLNGIAAGDTAFIREILAMIRSTSLSEFVLLKQAFYNGDCLQLGAIAHKIKAPLQMLGDAELNEWIIAIESQSKGNELPSSQVIDQLEARIAQISVAIESYLEA